MVKLNERLQVVADLIPVCDNFADIGTDHGYLPLYLLERHRIVRAYATDINQGPLERGKKNADKNQITTPISFLLGNGLEPLRDKKIDVMSICGMGGELIIQILKKEPETAKKCEAIILQPNNEASRLRKFLRENGYVILEEALIKDRHLFYEIIKIKPSDGVVTNYDLLENEVPINVREKYSDVLYEYLTYKIKVENNIIKGCSCSDDNMAKTKMKAAEQRKVYFQQKLKEMK